MIKSLQVRIHVTSISLIYKSIKVIREFLFQSQIEINKKIWVWLFKFKLDDFGLLYCTQLLSNFFYHFVLRFKPWQVNILPPHIKRQDIVIDLFDIRLIDFININKIFILWNYFLIFNFHQSILNYVFCVNTHVLQLFKNNYHYFFVLYMYNIFTCKSFTY